MQDHFGEQLETGLLSGKLALSETSALVSPSSSFDFFIKRSLMKLSFQPSEPLKGNKGGNKEADKRQQIWTDELILGN